MIKKWYIYIVECSDISLYTGITTDIERRLIEHNRGRKGAKYTKFKRPVTLKYIEICRNRSEASKRENIIKSWSREKKLKFIESYMSP